MRINDITLDVCVSSLGSYNYKPTDTSKELIIEANRYKKYIRFYLLEKHVGYVSKADKPVLMSILNKMNQYIRVENWSLVKNTPHYLILKLHLQSHPKYRFHIYQLSFKGTDDTYIGSTKNAPQRIHSHRIKLKSQKHVNHRLQKAYNTDPSNMEVTFLFTGETMNKDIQFQKEQEFILKHKPTLNLINSYTKKGKYVCGCGKEISYSCKNRHNKTQYHIKKITDLVLDHIITQVSNAC